jgi:hypothetical protein
MANMHGEVTKFNIQKINDTETKGLTKHFMWSLLDMHINNTCRSSIFMNFNMTIYMESIYTYRNIWVGLY